MDDDVTDARNIYENEWMVKAGLPPAVLDSPSFPQIMAAAVERIIWALVAGGVTDMSDLEIECHLLDDYTDDEGVEWPAEYAVVGIAKKP